MAQAPMTPPDQKEAIKQAIREWMDDMFAQFGRWTMKGLLVLAFAGCVYLALVSAGWHK